ncbi:MULTISPECIES: LysR family transcriptional regulator [unclassified Paenibacillus]|uniref:LysR family transcriptional regulator n=1 Tax=unclassified Paenibacillus TaxID=185978 RepID=UPI00070D8F52|nr:MULTISPECIES: LysR family transcriptional regulator [unclassified Paenibacillus]KQX45956.1 LysR family transcriptional regulator [Paenibacillus sp. Root444D2]KRE50872.1 LysR family transcriptional regulator [Paenibacillus sp. Soil724D2]
MTNCQVQLFVKIAETGSFTKAGHELNMTQPAVSRAILALESELDVALFIRDRKKGLILTDIGKRILILFRNILKDLEKVEQEVAAEKGLEVGTIRIGIFPTASAVILPKIIRVIQDSYPNLKFNLYEGTILEIKEWLVSRTIDIGLIIPPNDGLDIIPLYKEEMFVVFRDNHPLQSCSTIHIQDLNNVPMIMCKGGYDTFIFELFERANLTLQVKFAFQNVNIVLNMIQEGLGVSILPKLSLSTLPPNVITRSLDPILFREINLARPSLKESSIAVNLFIKTITDLFPHTGETQ